MTTQTAENEIQVAMRRVIRVGVKTITNHPSFADTYRGTVRVIEPDYDWTDDTGYRHHVTGRRYTKTLNIERPTASYALDDAMQHMEWCISVQQMP